MGALMEKLDGLGSGAPAPAERCQEQLTQPYPTAAAMESKGVERAEPELARGARAAAEAMDPRPREIDAVAPLTPKVEAAARDEALKSEQHKRAAAEAELLLKCEALAATEAKLAAQREQYDRAC